MNGEINNKIVSIRAINRELAECINKDVPLHVEM